MIIKILSTKPIKNYAALKIKRDYDTDQYDLNINLETLRFILDKEDDTYWLSFMDSEEEGDANGIVISAGENEIEVNKFLDKLIADLQELKLK